MFRFISFLLGRTWEPCKSCENLKQQLEFERSEKRLLIDTLVAIVKPKEIEAPPVEINQIAQSSSLFSRRRAALEEADRVKAKIEAEKKFVGLPDYLKDVDDKGITKLERELGVSHEKES
jgi:hypothetical protein